MNKILLGLIVCILMSASVFAQGQQGMNGQETGTLDSDNGEAGQGIDAAQQVTATSTATQQQNQGEDTQIQNEIRVKTRVQSGMYTTESGKQMQVQEQSNNRVQLRSGEVSAQTSMEMTQEQTQAGTKLQVKLSNGKNSEVKIMPDTASERALERLRLKVCSADNNCTIELKEVGKGNQTRAAYEVQAQKQSKIFGLFKKKMQVEAQVDAESGEVIQSKKPWWAFLASESEE